jgi:hypothetical protein
VRPNQECAGRSRSSRNLCLILVTCVRGVLDSPRT